LEIVKFVLNTPLGTESFFVGTRPQKEGTQNKILIVGARPNPLWIDFSKILKTQPRS